MLALLCVDESGSAAYFTVNIDDMLNGKPVQHRETQGEESQLFRSYFDSITYLTGGCDSGFKTVEPTSYKPRLLLVKGKMGKVQVSQIPLQSDLLNNGDVYILGKHIVPLGRQSAFAHHLQFVSLELSQFFDTAVWNRGLTLYILSTFTFPSTIRRQWPCYLSV